MMEDKLTPALEAELRFLRQQVDSWQHKALMRDADPKDKQNYHRAKADLTQFVSARRKEGYNI